MIDLQQNNRNSLIYILINSIIYLFFFPVEKLYYQIKLKPYQMRLLIIANI